MKVWLTLLLLAPLFCHAPGAEAASWAERKAACQKFLRMKPAQQAKIARPTGFSVAKTKSACRDLLAGHFNPRPRSAEPAWYADRCTVTRDCYAGHSCIRGACKPAAYGGCGNGIDSCPAGEFCVNGACR